MVNLVTPPTEQNLSDLVSSMRDADRAECIKAGYADPVQAIEFMISVSALAWAGVVDGRTIGVGGVYDTSTLTSDAKLWLLTSKHADSHKKSLVTAVKACFDMSRWRWNRLHVYVDLDNCNGCRLARRLGFLFDVSAPSSKLVLASWGR